MTFDEAIADYYKKYNILSVINLDDDDNLIFESLKSIKKDPYENNDRILILQYNADEYQFIDAPGAKISKLQQMLCNLDISNFFVTLITGNLDAASEIESVRLSNSVDVPFFYCIVDHKYTKSIIKYSNTTCVLPWINLYVGPNGDVLPCCMSNRNLPLGNIKNQTVDEIMNGTAANELRHNITNGYRVKSCEHCYNREDLGFVSPREVAKKQYQKYYPIVPFDTRSFDPIYLDIRLNNICNFKCRMCNGLLSSSIAQETKILYGNITKPLQQNLIQVNGVGSDDRKELFNKIKPYLTNKVKKIYFAGGEPLLAQEHYLTLEQLIAEGNTDIDIEYTTNLSTLRYKKILVTELWKKFKNVTVKASIDAHGPVAEYVRHGTVWSDIVDNIKYVQQECSHVNLQITSTVSLLTIESLMELQRSWHESGFFPLSKFNINVLTTPIFLSLPVLPQHFRRTLKFKVKSHIQWCKDNFADPLADQWSNMLNFMMGNDYSYALTEFKNQTNILDAARNENFSSIFPHYSELLK